MLYDVIAFHLQSFFSSGDWSWSDLTDKFFVFPVPPPKFKLETD